MVAFVVHPTGPPVMVRLGPLEAIERAVTAWRLRIEGEADATAEGAAVRRLVWDPLVPAIGTARNLVVVPDGPVGGSPLAALPTVAGRVLLEDFRIRYLPAARALGEADQSPAGPAADALLLVGGPEYGDSAGAATSMGVLGDVPPWSALPAAADEARTVEQHFADPARGRHGPVYPLTGPGADVSAVLARLTAGVKYFHFAGHGYFVEPAAAERAAPDRGGQLPTGAGAAQRQVFDRHSPLLAGLVLSGANTPAGRAAPERTILTAEVVNGLDLDGTDLVTLSACETGLGSVSGGEGVMGLQRAFLNAGARTVVASLWKVDDAATSVLMEEFYANLWGKKMSKAEALRQAQLAVYRDPGRVESRGTELVARGLVPARTRPLPGPPAAGAKTPPARWAAFVLAGAAD